jgi:hypothetical protein
LTAIAYDCLINENGKTNQETNQKADEEKAEKQKAIAYHNSKFYNNPHCQLSKAERRGKTFEEIQALKKAKMERYRS